MKSEKKKDFGELEVRFGGRCLKFEVLINTDEPDWAVAERLRKAAGGPGLRMAVVMGGALSPVDAKEVWDRVVPLMKDAAKNAGRA